MASDTLPPGETPPEAPPRQWTSPYEDAIDHRLQQTRRQVKAVDLASGLLVLSAAVLIYLMVATVLDQWLVAGGLGFWGRLVLFIGLLAVAGYCFARRLLPLLLYRISPTFAAYTIEQTQPSLKNSLINFLFLRQHREHFQRSVLEQRVYEGVEHTVASELTQIPAETVVDRSPVIRFGYVVAAALAICCLYLVLSPKNPLVSFSRVLWPWAEIQAPTRVTITGVEPGTTVAFQGDTLKVWAEVQGLRDGESVTLFYTTADKQSVNQAIPMSVPEKDYRYYAELPPDQAGLQQNVTYSIKAGDAQTRLYKVDVQTALAILVDRVDYHYPPYTGIADATVQGTGDLRAIEGTKVTIHATANQEIERAVMEMDGDPRQALRMNATEKQATGEFRLAMRADDPLRPKHESYQIRFNDRHGHDNRRPIRHQIEVIRDQPPEINFLNAPPKDVELPENGSLELKVRAEDPDFGLRRVAVRAEFDKKSLPTGRLLDKPPPEKALQGTFESGYRFEPARFHLKAGDRVVYWAEALDNKENDRGPTPNRSETERRWIIIVPAENPQQNRETPKDGQQGDGQQRPKDGQPGDKQPPKDESQPHDQAKPNQGDKDQPQGEKPNQNQQGPNDTPQKSQDQPQDKPNDQSQGMGQQNQSQGQQGDGDSAGNQGEKSSAQQDKGSNQQQQGGDKQGGDQQQQQGGNQQQQSGGQQGGSQQQKQEGGQSQGGESGQEGQGSSSGQPGGKSQSAGGQKGKTESGQGSESRGEPIDPDSNPGDAFDKILKYRNEEQQKQSPQGGENNAQSKPGQQGQGGQQQAGGQQGADQPQGGQQSAKQPQGQGDSKQPAGSKGSGSQKPQSQAGSKQPQDRQGSDQPSDGDAKNQPEKGEGQQQGRGGQQRSAEKRSDQGKPSGDPQPTGQDPQQGEKPGSDSKTGSQDQKGAGDQQGTNAAGKESGQQAGKPQRTPDKGSQGGPKPGEGQKPEAGQGAQTRNTGQSGQETGQQGMEKPDSKGGDPENSQGTGVKSQENPLGDNAGSPSPQEANRPKEQQSRDQRDSGQDQGPSGKSPSTSPKQSDSQGEQAGDRSGGGEDGGGQKSKQSGTGGAGSHTASEQGANQAQQQGEGKTGTKAGDQAKSDKPTGKSTEGQGDGSREGKQPGGQQPGGEKSQDQSPSAGGAKPSDQANSPSQGQSPNQRGGQGQGGSPSSGSAIGQQPDATSEPSKPEPTPVDEVNRKFAEEAVNLSLETLEDQLAKDNPDPKLLDRLGWNRDELERFYRQWNDMRRAAGQRGTNGNAVKNDWNKALQGLGLRPQGTELRGGASTADQQRGMRESRRVPPPPGWADQFRAYTESVAGEKPRK
ncbi:MAG: DUF4175 family protein [Thermoguttaceae bacterium]